NRCSSRRPPCRVYSLSNRTHGRSLKDRGPCGPQPEAYAWVTPKAPARVAFGPQAALASRRPTTKRRVPLGALPAGTMVPRTSPAREVAAVASAATTVAAFAARVESQPMRAMYATLGQDTGRPRTLDVPMLTLPADAPLAETVTTCQKAFC